jgi:hypothetical protein
MLGGEQKFTSQKSLVITVCPHLHNFIIYGLLNDAVSRSHYQCQMTKTVSE